MSVDEDLDDKYGDKKWAPNDPNRTLQQCADICDNRIGCTSFEYANGPKEHGACGTYTKGVKNLKDNENRNQANSNWYSCVSFWY